MLFYIKILIRMLNILIYERNKNAQQCLMAMSNISNTV